MYLHLLERKINNRLVDSRGDRRSVSKRSVCVTYATHRVVSSNVARISGNRLPVEDLLKVFQPKSNRCGLGDR